MVITSIQAAMQLANAVYTLSGFLVKLNTMYYMVSDTVAAPIEDQHTEFVKLYFNSINQPELFDKWLVDQQRWNTTHVCDVDLIPIELPLIPVRTAKHTYLLQNPVPPREFFIDDEDGDDRHVGYQHAVEANHRYITATGDAELLVAWTAATA